MKKLLYILTAILLVSCSDSSTIGKYKKLPLPAGFTYKIIEDKSNDALEKNQLVVEISKKITVEQIATLASKLYASKDKQRRFYIVYLLSGMELNAGAWATSNFDPELKIEIGGSTEIEDLKTSDTSDVKGTIIGKWRSEKSLSGAVLVFYKNVENSLTMRTSYKDGSKSDKLIKESKVNGTINYSDGNEFGAFFVIESNGNLGMYGKDGKFDEAVKIQ